MADSNKVIIDLASNAPELEEEWDYEKNGDLKPTMISVNSNKKVWWKCKKCGNEWSATVASRMKGRGCPYCSNQKVLTGFNDLASQNPALALEWHPTKNGELKPSMITPNSMKKVWWKCKKCGNEWSASVASRTKGQGCPLCNIKKG